MYKSISLLVIVFSFIALSSCRENDKEMALNRASSAKENDDIAKCRNYVEKDDFYKDYKLCDIFIKQDKDCEYFSEKKEECKGFFEAEYYEEIKYSCSELNNSMNKCEELVNKNLWYNYFFKYKDIDIVRKIFKYFDIDLNKSWTDSISLLNNPIYIATVSPSYAEKEFHQGVELAIEQINKSNGVFGRKIELVEYIQQDGLDHSREIAHKIINDISTVAVIGLQDSAPTKAVTQIYERSGILHIITAATMKDVVRPGMQLNFRLIPNNLEIASKVAEFCKNKGYKEIAILTERDDYAEELGKAFYDNVIEQGIKVNYSKTFFGFKSDFLDILRELSSRNVDAVYLSTWYEPAAKFIKQAKAIGLKLPIVATDALDNQQFINLVGVIGDGTILPSIYNEKAQHSENKKFLSLYRSKYGINPNTWAAQGYDAVNLMASIMESMQSTVPSEVASGLRFGQEWTGAGGVFQFNTNGELVDKELYFKELRLGEYRFVE